MQFATARPEDQGLPPGAILHCLRQLENVAEMHSFLLLRNDHLLAEVYWQPFRADTPHRMYSITKSLVSLAVGLLAEEGKLSLDDPMAGYFPEYSPPVPHPWLAATTLRHLLSMQSCHTATTYKREPGKNWVASFFATPPAKPPGTLFHYDSSASHVLCALCEKLAGVPLLEYLRVKCLGRAGLGGQAYILPDPFGVSMGGSGLMATPRDILRLGQLLLAGGNFQGEQLLPAGYLQEATGCRVPTAGAAVERAHSHGYGYGFWRVAGDGFAAYGKGGQYLLCWPKHRLAVVTTADAQDVAGGAAQMLDILTGSLLPALDRPAGPQAAGQAAQLDTFCDGAAIPTLPPGRPGGEYSGRYTILNEGPFTALQWRLGPGGGMLTLYDGQGGHNLFFGIGRLAVGEMPQGGGPCAATAGWAAQGQLEGRISLLGEESASILLRAAFTQDGCTLELRNTCEMCFEEYTGLWQARKEREGGGG